MAGEVSVTHHCGDALDGCSWPGPCSCQCRGCGYICFAGLALNAVTIADSANQFKHYWVVGSSLIGRGAHSGERIAQSEDGEYITLRYFGAGGISHKVEEWDMERLGF